MGEMHSRSVIANSGRADYDVERIEGAMLSVLFMFVPMACLAECFIGVKSAKRIIYAAFWCMLAAGIVFMAVNAAACKSISCHPLPTNIYP